ncbi:DUF1684 domain-containing protein [Inquilinus sp. KBS0705]|nr:DUF1684 domain-containing protein [Inquilinus sp. KBS0705]
MKYALSLLLILSTALSSLAQTYQAQIASYRQGYMNDFLEDKRSPLKKEDLSYLRFYDADSTYKVEAKSALMLNNQSFIMPVFSGTGSEYVPYALLKFTLKGQPMQLTVYRSVALAKTQAYKDYLFLPFTDETNGKETYAGGRYIDLREGDIKDGTVIIDFNKAYNPYCAFGSGYACPKPPDGNHLTIALQAGEKAFGKEH